MGAARKLVAADLFCGGGGFSKGFALACEDLGIRNIRLIAINHWKAAVDVHRVNHPWAEHHCSRVDQLDPRKLVPEGRMKILIASPECTNHANARGGRPMNDQSRATGWDVVKWAQELYIETILVENVREIMEWGPLGADGCPLKSKKGEIFRAWTDAIRKCGYRLEHRILNAADFGGATTRQRFFLIARRGNHRVTWPEPSHSKEAEKTGDLFRGLKPWRGAREIIDWSRRGKSIFNRKKPLARNTLARIEAGLRKFGGAAAEPFLVLLRGTQASQVNGSAHSVKEPLPTVTAGGIHAGLVEPFMVPIDQKSRGPGGARSVNDPVATIITQPSIALVEPFIITPGGADMGKGRSVKEPLPTVLCHERFAVVEPFILQQQSGGAPRSTKEPLPSIASKGAQAIVQPFILAPLGIGRGNAPRSVDQPMPTILASRGGGHLVEPFITQVNHGTSRKRNNSGRVHSVREPLGTITTERSHALVEPFLVKYNGTAKAAAIDKPLPTVTSVERLGLVEPQANVAPQQVLIDILFRMLEPHELARAMGFEGYEFKGTKKDRVKMIGNAVEVNTAKALVKAILENP
jgi:DNA (cytosine-5)-methyltransferase 1